MATVFNAAALAVLTSIVSFVDGATEPASGSQPPLLPAVHWDHNKADLQNLVPVDSHRLYYSMGGVADPTIEHIFTSVDTKIAYPAVILDHSQYVKSVQCQGQSLDIRFTDSNSYEFAKEAWTSNTVLVTDTNGCGTSNIERTFWLIDSFAAGSCDTCINAVIDKEIATEDAMDEIDLVWGTYTPTNGPVSPGTSGSGSLSARSLMDEAPSGASPKLGLRPPQKRQAAATSAPAAAAASGGPFAAASGGSAGAAAAASGAISVAPPAASAVPCGAPPSAVIDGLPAATCNSTTFDQDLDNAIGYLDFDSSHYSSSLQDFVPGLDDYNADDYSGFDPLPSRLRRRQVVQKVLKVLFGKKIADALVGVAQRAQQLGGVAESIFNAVKTAGKKAVNFVDNAFQIDKKAQLTSSFNVNPPTNILKSSPFGNALQFYSNKFQSKNGKTEGQVTAYCVNCGASGTISLGGRAKVTVLKGLHELTVNMNGNFKAALAIGIDANVDFPPQSLKENILTVGLPGFFVPGVITVGPAVELGLEADLSVSLAGQVLAGATVEIPNFAANLDLLSGDRSRSGTFTPQFKRVFNASGSITATASLGIPIYFSIGVFVPKAKIRKSASVSNKPAFVATMSYSTSNTGTNTCNNGISLGLDFVNTISADLFGARQWTIKEDRFPLGSSCQSFGGKPAAGSSRRRMSKKRQQIDPNVAGLPADFVTSPESNLTANDTLAQAANEAALESVLSAELAINASQVPFSGDATFVTITTLGGANELASDEDGGNIYYASPGYGSLFPIVEGFIEGDINGNFFHFYNDTMAKYNVSRFRFSNESFIPKSADFVALAPINYDNDNQTSDVYVGLDLVGDVFYPITCDIQDQASKAFLVRDINFGIQTLENPDLRYTVTGGVVESCYFLAWAAPPGSASNVASNTTSPQAAAAASSYAPLPSSAAPTAPFSAVNPYFASLAAAASNSNAPVITPSSQAAAATSAGSDFGTSVLPPSAVPTAALADFLSSPAAVATGTPAASSPSSAPAAAAATSAAGS